MSGRVPLLPTAAAVGRPTWRCGNGKRPVHRITTVPLLRPTPDGGRQMLTKLLTAKAVTVAALTAAVAVGGVATAATVARSDNDTGKTVSALHKADAAEDAGKPDSAGQAGGPDATGAAKKGLCTAWAAGKGAENGAKEDAAAFQALAKAAGGAGNVASFCAEATAASKGRAEDVELAAAAKSGLCRAWAAGEA